jgi:hypothetical protein
VTPLIVTWLWPAVIVPLSVPASVPVPVFRLSRIGVSAATLPALPTESCDCTVTENAVPAVGLEPPLIEVITSRSASDETVNGAEVPAVRTLPLVRVAEIWTPGSAFV